jgi:hypothetical protein
MLARVDRQAHQARHDLRDVPARRASALGRNVRHDDLGVLERELVHADVLDVRHHVEPEELLVSVRGVLRGHVVGVLLRELAVGPILRELGERRHLR